jgi:putative copper export protein
MMNLRWLKVTLRIVAVILLSVAAVRFARSISFQTETEPTAGGVTIDHVLEFGHVAIVVPLIALLLFVLSFVVPSKRV